MGQTVFFGNPNGTALSFMQRFFYILPIHPHMKAGASVVSCRRGENSATFETMDRLFGIRGIAAAPSTYRSDAHDHTAKTRARTSRTQRPHTTRIAPCSS